MRVLHLPIAARIGAALRERDWFGVAVEMFAVLLGVLLALQSSAWVERQKDREYRARTVATLDTVLDRFADRGQQIASEIDEQLARFDDARSRGQRPAPPFYVETKRGDFSGERPPTALWSAIVATGVAQSLHPEQLLRLTLFFDRADTFGDRYIRYNAMTEAQIVPHLNEPSHFYAPDGRLKPLIADHVEQLRGIGGASREMSKQARALQHELSVS